MNLKRIAVISTGNGGQAMAAYLALHGYSVALYAREQERVDMFHTNKFTLSGIESGTANIDLISCDMEEIIRDAAIVLVTTPAQYHPIVARAMAKHLENYQLVVLNPGRTLGTYAFEKTLQESGLNADILLCETETFPFTCRCIAPGNPMIYGIKKDVKLAAHHPNKTAAAVARLTPLFPAIIPAKSVFETGFANMGMVFHPLPILMNITRVEHKEGFHFYTEGISPLVANILTRLDAERVAVACAANVIVPDALTWLKHHYGASGDTLYEGFQSTQAYKNVMAPTDIDTRYIFEDVCTGCVPVSAIGKLLNVPTPIIDSVIAWATAVYDYDFYSNGRNETMFNLKELIQGIGEA